jgi:ribosome-associated toxin RatA of RatAB toxin-antitoxin module
VLATHADGVTAEVGLALAGLHQRFTTRNTYDADRSVVLHLVQGPFSELEGRWTFDPVGEPGQRGCRVQLQLQYGFSSAPLAALIGPLFDRIAASLVDAFVKRASHVYG